MLLHEVSRLQTLQKCTFLFLTEMFYGAKHWTSPESKLYFWKLQYIMEMNFSSTNTSSLQCYSILSDILVKNELCIPLERGPNVLSTGEGFICLSPPSKLKIAVLFCSIYKKTFC